MRQIPPIFKAGSGLLVLAITLLGAFTGAAVDFETDVAPLLEAKCLGCHQPNILKGDFSLATRADMMASEGTKLDSRATSVTVPTLAPARA